MFFARATLFTLFATASVASPAAPPDTIYYSAKIVTVDGSFSLA